MAKKKEVKNKLTPEELAEQNRQSRLRDIRSRLSIIPEPTYKFNVGDRVEIGNLEDVYVIEILDNGKIYGIDYSTTDTNYGNPIKHEHQRMYVIWIDIRKFQDNNDESLINNEDIRLYYSQRDMHDIFSKAYHFGINFEPEYQREFVWSLEDKIALIDSIFNNVDIGKFTFIHYESDKWLETGFGYEILDGKQRLRAILDFYEDRFKYKGKYFSELSYKDRYHFKSYPIVQSEARNLTQEQILRYFIILNTNGRIMAKEHLDKVRGMLESI